MSASADTRGPDAAPERVVAAVEALLLAAEAPVSLDRLVAMIAVDEAIDKPLARDALGALARRYAASAAEVIEVASGWRLQVRAAHADLVGRLWEERPPRLSRALLETLAIIVYRQPLARSDIEAIRGVSVSTGIIKTLAEYEWIKVIGHRDVPGRPALYATTPRFLDDFGVARLADLPSLPEIKDGDALEAAIAQLGVGDSETTAAGDHADAADAFAEAATETGRPADDDRPLE